MDEHAPAPPSKPLVLVAEDDRDFCDLLSMWLQRDYHLLVAFDGDNALSIAHRCSPDAALVDVMMPRLSGFGLMWAFSHHPRLSRIPVAFMTAYHGVDGNAPRDARVLRKPFTKETLTGVLHDMVAGRPAGPGPTGRPSDHRRTRRVGVDMSATLARHDVTLSGRMLSLSFLGAYFEAPQPLPIGTTWLLTFESRGTIHRVPVEVVHNMDMDGRRGAGLCMHDLDLDEEKALERLMEQLL